MNGVRKKESGKGGRKGLHYKKVILSGRADVLEDIDLPVLKEVFGCFEIPCSFLRSTSGQLLLSVTFMKRLADLVMLFHATILSRLDYCNVLYGGVLENSTEASFGTSVTQTGGLLISWGN